MTSIYRRCGVSFFFSLAAAQISMADQVTLKNGDRVTGAIVKMDGKTLTVKSEFFGTVTMPWAQVAAIQSDAQLNVVLPTGETVRATLRTAQDKVELQETQRSLALSEVITIRNAAEQRAYERLLNPGWRELWAGSITFGLAGTLGNAQTRTITTGLNAARATRSDKASLYFSAVQAAATVNRVTSDTAQAVRGGWGYNRNVSPRFFINTFNDYEYDRFQNLDLRFALGGGMGYEAWRREKNFLEFVGGAGYNREKFSPAAPDISFVRDSAEAYWGEDWSHRLNTSTSLVQSFRMFNNLSDTGEFRLKFDISVNTRLRSWLTWNVALSDRYLSNPSPGRKTNDILYTTGVGITFAR